MASVKQQHTRDVGMQKLSATCSLPTQQTPKICSKKKKKPICVCVCVHVWDIKGCVPYPQPFSTFKFITLVDVMV